MALAYAIEVAFLFFKNAGRIYYEKRLKCKNVTQMQNIKYFTATYMMGEYGCQNSAPKNENSARVTCKFCAPFFVNFAQILLTFSS